MSSGVVHPPLARPRWRAVDLAVLLVGLAAAASTFLPLVDAEELYLCGCSEPFRLGDGLGYAPALVLAARAALRIGRPGRVVAWLPLRVAGTAFAIAATFLVVMLVSLCAKGTLVGAGAISIGGSHGVLIALLAADALARLVAWIRRP